MVSVLDSAFVDLLDFISSITSLISLVYVSVVFPSIPSDIFEYTQTYSFGSPNLSSASDVESGSSTLLSPYNSPSMFIMNPCSLLNSNALSIVSLFGLFIGFGATILASYSFIALDPPGNDSLGILSLNQSSIKLSLSSSDIFLSISAPRVIFSVFDSALGASVLASATGVVVSVSVGASVVDFQFFIFFTFPKVLESFVIDLNESNVVLPTALSSSKTFPNLEEGVADLYSVG